MTGSENEGGENTLMCELPNKIARHLVHARCSNLAPQPSRRRSRVLSRLSCVAAAGWRAAARRPAPRRRRAPASPTRAERARRTVRTILFFQPFTSGSRMVSRNS